MPCRRTATRSRRWRPWLVPDERPRGGRDGTSVGRLTARTAAAAYPALASRMSPPISPNSTSPIPNSTADAPGRPSSTTSSTSGAHGRTFAARSCALGERKGSSTPKPSSPGTGRMLRTNASTWIRARHDSAAASPTAIGTTPTTSDQRHREDEVHRGPGERHQAAGRRATGSRRGRSAPPRPAAGSRPAAGRAPAARTSGRRWCSGGCRGSGSRVPGRTSRRCGGRRARGRTRAGTATPPSRPRTTSTIPATSTAPVPIAARTAPAAVAPRRSRKNGLIPRITASTKPVCPKRRPSGWSPSLGRPPTLAPPLPTPMYLQPCHSPVQGEVGE